MLDQNEMFLRLRMFIGDKAFKKLQNAKILLIGLGGVGGSAAKALARSGILNIDLVDGDIFCLSNINRQAFATTKNLGQKKVYVAKNSLLEINPNIKIKSYDFFYCSKTEDMFNLKKYSFVVDAIDDVEAKICLIKNAKKNNVNIISAMGAGNKKDINALFIDDVFKTYNCPLAKIMRKRLKEEKIEQLTVAFSKEKPQKLAFECIENKKKAVASTAFVPPAMGLLIATHVVNVLIENV